MPRVDNSPSPIVPKLEGVHLFHFDGAPCAQRVRFALAEKGLHRGREVRYDADDPKSCAGEDNAWTSRIVSLIKKDHLTETYAAIQPNLVVPALVHDGELYVESMDIIAYLDTAFGGEPLVPRHDPQLLADAEELTAAGKALHRSIRFVTFRWGLGALGRLNRKEEAQLAELVRQGSDGEHLLEFYEGYDSNTIDESIYFEHLAKLGEAFDGLDRRLTDGRSFLTGETLTMADVIWAMKVLRLDECGYPFAKRHPAVHEWYGRIYSRPSFQSGVMGKHRVLNFAFRTKARIESMLGLGLQRAIFQHA